MTAHALKGDRERCLAAGMDDYISKPIQPQQLYEVLAKYAPTTETDTSGVENLPKPQGHALSECLATVAEPWPDREPQKTR